MDFSRMRYFDEGELRTFPEWGAYYVNAGQKIVSFNESNHRTIQVFSVPDTRYVAALLAFGFVTERVLNAKTLASSEAHFSTLRKLDLGTTVLYEDRPGKYQKGTLVAARNQEEFKEMIAVKTGKGKKEMVARVPKAMVNKIQMSHEKISASGASFNRPFLSKLLGNKSNEIVAKFCTNSVLECLLVGELTRLREEIVGTRIGILDGAHDNSKNLQLIEGNIQDVLRVSRFNSTVNPFFRSVIHQPSKKTNPQYEEPGCVIFTNASAFIKTWNRYQGLNWIVVIAPVEPRYEEAMYFIEEYLETSNSELIPNLHEPSLNVETLSIREAVSG